MKRVAVFQHVPYEILGTFLPLIKKAGIGIRYTNFGRDPHIKIDVDEYDGLVILGGPMGVYDTEHHPHLAHEIECIQKAIQQSKPVLGICLGAQLIATALGGRVLLGPAKEIGWQKVSLTKQGRKDPMLGHCEADETIFQWHQDYIEPPAQATVLARSELCACQAFRYGENVYGFQFHLEVDTALIERWLTIPTFQSWLDSELTRKIREETAVHISRSMLLSNQVFSKYLSLFSTKTRKVVLGSRSPG